MEKLYIDTNVIIGSLIDKQSIKQDFCKSLYKAKKGIYNIVIPQTILGESVEKIVSKSSGQERLSNLQNLMIVISEMSGYSIFPPLNKEVVEIINELKSLDYKLDYCDLSLLGHALLDPTSCMIFTTDRAIHNSTKIHDYIENKGRKINVVMEIP